MKDYRKLAQAAIKILEAGHKEEAREILEGATKTAFWKKIHDKDLGNIDSWVLDPLMKNKNQRPHISDGRKLIDDVVLQPLLGRVKARHTKKPLYLLEKGAAKNIIRDFQNSNRWKLWKKDAKKLWFATKKEAYDRTSKRNDLVFAAEVIPSKNRMRMYFAHLASLGRSSLFPLNYFETEGAFFDQANLPHDWNIGLMSGKDDPGYTDSALVALSFTTPIKQFNGIVFKNSNTTANDLVVSVNNSINAASQVAWVNAGRPGDWKNYNSRTFYAMIQVDKTSWERLHPEDQKFLWDKLYKENREMKVVDYFELYS